MRFFDRKAFEKKHPGSFEGIVRKAPLPKMTGRIGLPPQRRRGTIEDGGGGIIPDRLRRIRKINVGRGLAPAVIFVYYVPPFL